MRKKRNLDIIKNIRWRETPSLLVIFELTQKKKCLPIFI